MREVDRFSRLDPSLDYVKQTAEAAAYRLQQEPKNPSHAYTLGFAHVLSRQVAAARNALQRVVELDSKNPNAYAYLAFVNLYDLRPKAAETALASALKLDPSIPELHGLNGIAALMQGHFQQAWKAIQTYQQRSADRAKTKP
jgi:cytochrome c-type biogenesis protein CcmH/NrfG